MVACQLEELKECARSQKKLEYILEGLPMTLEASYNQILSRIPPANASDAVKLLLWLAFAEQPLEIDYLAVIVEFDMDEKIFDPKAKLSAPTDTLKICSSLVTKLGNNTVKLAHASVKQYILEKKRTLQSNIVMDPSIGHAFVGQCCLAYILCSESEQYIDSGNALIRYCTKYWPKHIIAANCEAAVIQQMKELFVPTSSLFQHWVHLYNDMVDDDGWMLSEGPLQCAALHGLSAIIDWMLPTVVTNVELADALFAAAKHGQLAAVEVLVNDMDSGNNHVVKAIKHLLDVLLGKVITRKEHMQKALYIASQEGHKEIAAFLLERGTGVNADAGFHGNALQVASFKGCKEVVQLLLKRGAYVNAQGRIYGNALQAASCAGHKEVVQLLLESGIDVNAQGGEYGNALQAASYNGNKEVVQLLLEGGAYVNVQGGKYENALQAASYKGCKEVVELLLQEGADVNAQGGQYGNALQAASSECQKQVIQLLLERGADINAQGGEYGNALQAASHNSYIMNKEVVQLLLERGADINAPGGIYGNALQAASYKGNYDIVQLLLQSGAKGHAVPFKLPWKSYEFGNALEAAFVKGHMETAKLLLDHGVEQEQLDAAFHWPIAGKRDVVNLLLKYGARFERI